MISDKSEVSQETTMLCPSRLIHPYSPRSLQCSHSLTFLSIRGLNESILDCARHLRLLRPEIMEQIMRADSKTVQFRISISTITNPLMFTGRPIQAKGDERLPTNRQVRHL